MPKKTKSRVNSGLEIISQDLLSPHWIAAVHRGGLLYNVWRMLRCRVDRSNHFLIKQCDVVKLYVIWRSVRCVCGVVLTLERLVLHVNSTVDRFMISVTQLFRMNTGNKLCLIQHLLLDILDAGGCFRAMNIDSMHSRDGFVLVYSITSFESFCVQGRHQTTPRQSTIGSCGESV